MFSTSWKSSDISALDEPTTFYGSNITFPSLHSDIVGVRLNINGQDGVDWRGYYGPWVANPSIRILYKYGEYSAFL